jgi:hypothetical protein
MGAPKTGHSFMLPVQDDDSRIVERLGNISCSVFRPIVDDDHFPVLQGLGQNAADAVTDECSMLVS